MNLSSFLMLLKHLALKTGFDIQRRDNTLAAARTRAIQRHEISVILDVGANAGQYGCELRRNGYNDRLVSFEPLPDAHETLLGVRRHDPAWNSLNIALGSVDGRAEMLVATNSVSSSLLPVTDVSVDADAGTAQVRKCEIEVRRLDSILTSLVPDVCGLMLKMDTQGFELEVLKGAESSLNRIDVIECELSLREVYGGQPLFYDVSRYLYERGFCATWIERGFQGPMRDLLQMDALFVRERSSSG